MSEVLKGIEMVLGIDELRDRLATAEAAARKCGEEMATVQARAEKAERETIRAYEECERLGKKLGITQDDLGRMKRMEQGHLREYEEQVNLRQAAEARVTELGRQLEATHANWTAAEQERNAFRARVTELEEEVRLWKCLDFESPAEATKEWNIMDARILELERELAAARAERDHYRTCADASELLVGAEEMRQATEDQLAATRAEATQDRNKLADSRDKARAERDEARAAAAKANERAEREIAEAVYEAGLRKDAEADCAALRARCEALAEALREAMSDLQWMSGSADFSPEGQAHVGWVKVRENLDRYNALLAAPAPEEP